MKIVHRLTTLTLIVTILVAPRGAAQAQSGDVQYFPQTGHNVRGAFLQFYRAANDSILAYGYPITEQMTSTDGKTVQYFQRARFELTNTAVQLTALGRITYQAASPLVINNTSGCELFPTNYRVCYSFLDFYKNNGGAKQFGNPISPFESHDGMIVQYFEGARFEWHADRPTGQWVVLSDLGRIYFDQLGEDHAYLKPVPPLDATHQFCPLTECTCLCSEIGHTKKWKANCLRNRAKSNITSRLCRDRQSHCSPIERQNGRIYIHYKAFPASVNSHSISAIKDRGNSL